MKDRNAFYSMGCYGWHKGFYVDEDFEKTLWNINYSDYGEVPEDDDMFPYDSAHQLLCGSCNIFALALQKVLGYNIYIIEQIKGNGFHAFCQVYKDRRWHYIDARGITTSFDEFMDIAGRFVKEEFIIQLATDEDIKEWENDDYFEEAFAFAGAVIEKYKECYTL